ncbi:MAG: Mur ligase domain-containing protein [Oscillospiraceae bacterium]
MKELTLKQIADWCGGKVSARFEHLRVSRMQSDSRKVRSGDLFVALKGAKADGHDFAETAINHGAVAALVSRPISEKLPSIEVEDTLRAYGEIAAGYRKADRREGRRHHRLRRQDDHEGNDRQRPRGGVSHGQDRGQP